MLNTEVANSHRGTGSETCLGPAQAHFGSRGCLKAQKYLVHAPNLVWLVQEAQGGKDKMNISHGLRFLLEVIRRTDRNSINELVLAQDQLQPEVCGNSENSGEAHTCV